MHLVAQYRQFAIDYRRLAAMLRDRADKQALALLAIGWDRAAEKREAMLRRALVRVAPAVVSVPTPPRPRAALRAPPGS
jgi:hypothetical protein